VGGEKRNVNTILVRNLIESGEVEDQDMDLSD
jgi:hypothetical protein